MLNKQRMQQSDLSDMFYATILSFEREAQRIARKMMSSLRGSSAKRLTNK
jgi:hypothetical protein